MAGHLEMAFHGQTLAESHPLLLCRLCIYSLSYNENRFFLRNSMAPHFKTLPVRKQLTKYLNSAQKNSIRFTYFSWCGKNYFVIQCCHKYVICNLKHLLVRKTLSLCSILFFRCVNYKTTFLYFYIRRS